MSDLTKYVDQVKAGKALHFGFLQGKKQHGLVITDRKIEGSTEELLRKQVDAASAHPIKGWVVWDGTALLFIVETPPPAGLKDLCKQAATRQDAKLVTYKYKVVVAADQEKEFGARAEAVAFPVLRKISPETPNGKRIHALYKELKDKQFKNDWIGGLYDLGQLELLVAGEQAGAAAPEPEKPPPSPLAAASHEADHLVGVRLAAVLPAAKQLASRNDPDGAKAKDLLGSIKSSIADRHTAEALDKLAVLENLVRTAAAHSAAAPARHPAAGQPHAAPAAEQAAGDSNGVPGGPTKEEVDHELKEIVAEVRKYLAEHHGDQTLSAELTKKLKEAQTLREQGHYDLALAACAEIRDALQSPPPAAPHEPDLSKKQREEHAERDAVQLGERQKDLDEMLVGEALGEMFQELMAEHRWLVPAERAACDGVRCFEDLMTLASPEARRAKVEAITAAVEGARVRRQQFASALEEWGLPTREVRHETAAYQVALAFKARMLDHLPEALVLETDLLQRLANLEQAEARDPEDLKAELDELKAPSAEKDWEREAFLNAIGQGSLNPAEAAAFYFDRPVRPLTREQQLVLGEANESAIRRAQRVKDLGGSVKDVEASLSHIPEEFWPPQFIEKLQAWRVVEREMRDQRVADLFKNSPALSDLKRKEIIAGTAGITDTVSAVMQILGGTSDLTKFLEGAQAGPLDGSTDNASVGKDVRFVVEESAEVAKLLAPIVKNIQDKVPQQHWHETKVSLSPKEIEDLLNVIARVEAVASKAKYLTAIPGLEALGQFFPVVSALSSGTDLAKCLWQLKDCGTLSAKAQAALDRVDLDFFSGKSNDRALVNAVANERNGQFLRTGKKLVETGAKGLGFAGDLASTAGVFSGGADHGAGQIAGAGLKVVGKTIELGNKIIFAGIDWRMVRRAKKTLREAQAGNPQAQVEIFQNSALYAKMYLVLLAKKNHPEARKFLIDRRITEDDLNKATAMKIVGDLLKASEQRDEFRSGGFFTVMSDSLLTGDATKLMKATGQTAKNTGNWAANKYAQVKDKVLPPTPFVPGQWQPGPVAPAAGADLVSAEQWRAAKNGAIANGLYNEDTGISKALEQASAALARAKAAYADVLATPKTRKSRILKAKKALLQAADVVYAYRPISNKGEPYTEMVEYAVELRTHLLTKRNELDRWLFEIGAKKPQWQPVKEGWTATDWAANWTDAAENCCLSKKDGGVGKHLAAYEKAVDDADAKDHSQRPAEARAARIKARNRLAKASEALTNVYVRSAEYPDLRRYVDRWLGKVAEWSKEVVGKLEDTGPPDDHPGMKEEQKFTPEGWSACFHEATRHSFFEVALEPCTAGSAISRGPLGST
jgi:hypothetical protein